MNGPWKFLTARKILPLPDLLSKFKRSKLLAARKENFLSLLVLAKKSQCTACSQMLGKTICHPYFLYRPYMLKSPFPRKLNNVSVGVYVYTPAIEHLV